MSSVVIQLLLVGNVLLLALVLVRMKASVSPKAENAPKEKDDAPQPVDSANDNQEEKSEQPQVDIVGKSALDIDEWRKMIREEIHEAIPLIVKEYGTYADAGWPEPEDEDDIVVRKEDFAKVFSNMTAADLTGEAPEANEPRADGIDFNQMDTTVKVLNGKSDSPKDVETARRVLSTAGDAEIFEVIKLDPVIQKRILMIEYQMPKATNDDAAESVAEKDETEARPKPKKIVYHADINTEGIDAIDFNIYH